FGPAHAATVTVDIIDFSFRPANVTVQVGDTVEWRQRDPIQHTSTSGVSPSPDGKWDSGFLNSGEMFQVTFDAPGEFPYFCRPHPNMIGRVTVEGAPPATPVVTI